MQHPVAVVRWRRQPQDRATHGTYRRHRLLRQAGKQRRPRARREHDLKADELVAAQEAVTRRQTDAALEIRKLEAQLSYHRLQVGASEQRATRAGTVRHGFDSRTGQRYAEGRTAYPGEQVVEVAGAGAMGVRAYALEPERAALAKASVTLVEV